MLDPQEKYRRHYIVKTCFTTFPVNKKSTFSLMLELNFSILYGLYSNDVSLDYRQGK